MVELKGDTESFSLRIKGEKLSVTNHITQKQTMPNKISQNNRFPSLDGWRGLSILFILVAHLLPLSPKTWQLNSTVAATGMVIFFNLSGFLITTILLRNNDIFPFLIRRFMRIIPLAWLVLLFSLIVGNATPNLYLPHLLFYANWPPMALTPYTSHFWSLCVEMQFYIAIAFIIAIFRKKAFILLPIACFMVTSLRIFDGVGIAVNTYYRVDEILAGSILALFFSSNHKSITQFFQALNPLLIFPFVLISAHPEGGFFQYLRPYFAMLLVGSTLFNQENNWWAKGLNSKFLFYIASISYALYVIHGGLRATWLGDGDTLIRYTKRPLFFIVTFGLAHLSTFYYEKYWISLAKKLTTRNL